MHAFLKMENREHEIQKITEAFLERGNDNYAYYHYCCENMITVLRKSILGDKWILNEVHKVLLKLLSNAAEEPVVNTEISEFECDPSLSFAENLDKLYTKLGVSPIKRKFWVDFFCSLSADIENEEALRDEILFYSKFRLFDATQRYKLLY